VDFLRLARCARIVGVGELEGLCHSQLYNRCGRRKCSADVRVSSARALGVNFRGLLVCSPRRVATVYICSATTTNKMFEVNDCAQLRAL